MKTGIFNWFGYQIPNSERFKYIKEAGFDSVLLWWGDEFAEYDGDKNLLPAMARNLGLDIENVHAPFDNANRIWTENIDADDLIEMYSDCILDCAKHNIPTVVIHLTKGYTPPPISQIGLDRISSLVDLAERKGINIALENLRRPDYLESVFRNIKSDRLGFCYDSGHENCYTKGTDMLSSYGDKLKALHLHDNDGSDDQHRIPGEGTVNWETIVTKIKSINYSGPITLEVTNEFSNVYSKTSPEDFLKLANKKITHLFY